jgi:hypothetical protein
MYRVVWQKSTGISEALALSFIREMSIDDGVESISVTSVNIYQTTRNNSPYYGDLQVI